ncbi:FAD-dependent monooxygenase [Pseudonocardia sp. TRM90224]|uniref:FAD-dependent monooxygenase n=1 Tax=Pseudonocardia sp. TRM90224 TaxID=2812678 RepID=UPI001E487117|nr:FAD-dependent monooxygenase [Pseudonocardia sp. TRM90224]
MTGTAHTVLISGASVAGPTLAYWLRRHGFTPTVVERAAAPRVGGQAIDVRGVAVDVVDRMGVLAEVRAARTQMRGMAFVDENGAELMSTTTMTFTGGPTEGSDVEILRDDLSTILLKATEGIEYLYGDSINGITQHADGVDVTFEKAEPRTFDLVIGADGLHSAVRGLAFGPERDCVTHLGKYLSVFTAPNFLDLDRWQIFHQTTPGAMAGLYTARNNTETRVNMGFESEPFDYDHRDVEQQKKLIADAFAGAGWEVPRMVEEMWRSPDFYFDSMAQVHLDSWARGRVSLVGDAGYCASPLSGQGTSLALVGAYVLAGELKAAGGDHAAAFASYEREMREFVAANQHLATINGEQMKTLLEEQAQDDDAIEQRVGDHWVASAANLITLKDY